jgi:hypothetical protein
MKIPFSIDDFLGVFERYNLSLWPLQVLFYLLAILVVVWLVRDGPSAHRRVFALLSFFWLWMGTVYHIFFFSSINKAAFVFGALFILQGILFHYFGVVRQSVSFGNRLNGTRILGGVLIVYALVLYPLLGFALGHEFPRSPTFGVPCPTTIFTFGVLLFAENQIPWRMLIIPLVWSVIGFSAALNLNIGEDYGLVVAGLLVVYVRIYKSKSPNPSMI